MKQFKKPEFGLEVNHPNSALIDNSQQISALQNQVSTAHNFQYQAEFIKQMEDITKLNANLAYEIKDTKIDDLKDKLKDLMDDLSEGDEEKGDLNQL